MSTSVRRVEVMVCRILSNDRGDWWTEYVAIPAGTSDNRIEDAAVAAFWEMYEKQNRDDEIARVIIYYVPELDDEESQETQ